MCGIYGAFDPSTPLVELRAQFIDQGHRFRSHSDCGVLVHLYEKKGRALLDEKKHCLLGLSRRCQEAQPA